MELLVLSPFVPWPLDHGGKIRVFNILRERARRHRVTLACLTPSGQPELGPLPELCERRIVVERRPSPMTDLPAFLAGRGAYNVLRYRSRAFDSALRSLAAERRFDQVQVEFSFMWQFARHFSGVPTLLVAHNVEAEVVRQLRGATQNPLRRWLYRIEERRLRRFEERAWSECSWCCAVSDSEREVIAAHRADPATVVTVPNGVDLERFEFQQRSASGSTVLLLGGLDYRPNLDGVEWFLREVLPHLRSRSRDAIVEIVGKQADRAPIAAGERGVRRHGRVDDIVPWMRRASVLAVPLRVGAGTRIKILEAMAAGLPVVTTSRGCEGLEVENGTHLLIADEAAGFGKALADVMTDHGLALRLAQRAREFVQAGFDWRALADRLEGLRR